MSKKELLKPLILNQETKRGSCMMENYKPIKIVEIMNEAEKINKPQGNGVLPCVMPFFRIGDNVYHLGRKMEAKIVSLYKEPEPDGTPCDFWCDIKFSDGAIWISQDATFDKNINGNTTIRLLNKA